ncbi:RNA polymerase-binding protein DksA [Plasticicumulans acidivorans]|uniref:RNA polymerase-binding transcription factor DksA n=1 Tax=Plasticicumulans acidivorans TaxID=886464 RepID=A0A317MVU6_9GAMM|nr:RNA polymerase-binding protein DksA [Plasticicumulans acidivorans]PWV61765.1 TraR/DksA family transcriptional regulator [Plasticicumulans acidivorans]
MAIELPADYKPSPDEPYMNPRQLEYFRRKLLSWRQELFNEAQATIDAMREAPHEVADEADRANRESDTSFELRTRDRYRKLQTKIDEALKRIENGEYGYCEETGEEIGLKRLEARPIATLTVEAQERRERQQAQVADPHY